MVNVALCRLCKGSRRVLVPFRPADPARAADRLFRCPACDGSGLRPSDPDGGGPEGSQTGYVS